MPEWHQPSLPRLAASLLVTTVLRSVGRSAVRAPCVQFSDGRARMPSDSHRFQTRRWHAAVCPAVQWFSDARGSHSLSDKLKGKCYVFTCQIVTRNVLQSCPVSAKEISVSAMCLCGSPTLVIRMWHLNWLTGDIKVMFNCWRFFAFSTTNLEVCLTTLFSLVIYVVYCRIIFHIHHVLVSKDEEYGSSFNSLKTCLHQSFYDIVFWYSMISLCRVTLVESRHPTFC